MSTELAIRETFAPAPAEAIEIWAEEMEGSTPEFLTVVTPSAGGTTWEIEGETPTKEIQGVVVDDYEAHALYLEAYNGESRPADAYWIAGECQYLTDAARKQGYTESSHEQRDDRISNRLVLYVARPNEIVPKRLDLSGPSVRPWRSFKQQQIVGKLDERQRPHRVTSAAVSLELESKKYPSGFSGSILSPRLLGFLDEDQTQVYTSMREQVKPFTRVRFAPTGDSGNDWVAAPVSEPIRTVVHPPAEEFAPTQVNDRQAAIDDDIPF